MKTWSFMLRGGVVGVLYLLGVFVFEYVAACHFRWEGMCGIVTVMANFPATYIIDVLLDVQETYMILASYLIINFLLGMALFGLIRLLSGPLEKVVAYIED
jgi:hypothetical protein